VSAYDLWRRQTKRRELDPQSVPLAPLCQHGVSPREAAAKRHRSPIAARSIGSPSSIGGRAIKRRDIPNKPGKAAGDELRRQVESIVRIWREHYHRDPHADEVLKHLTPQFHGRSLRRIRDLVRETSAEMDNARPLLVGYAVIGNGNDTIVGIATVIRKPDTE
jgi:hypothetical protein